MHLEDRQMRVNRGPNRTDCIFCMSSQIVSAEGPQQLQSVTLRIIHFTFYLSFCSEDQVIEHYKKLKGLTRGEAIVK